MVGARPLAAPSRDIGKIARMAFGLAVSHMRRGVHGHAAGAGVAVLVA